MFSENNHSVFRLNRRPLFNDKLLKKMHQNYFDLRNKLKTFIETKLSSNYNILLINDAGLKSCVYMARFVNKQTFYSLHQDKKKDLCPTLS